jgi:hypothetical protein
MGNNSSSNSNAESKVLSSRNKDDIVKHLYADYFMRENKLQLL